KSPRRTLPAKTAYWTGSARSRPSSRRTRMISLVGASGGKSSGTGSPDRRMTTKTTVVTSQTATSARRSFGPRKPRTARIGDGAPGAPAREPRVLRPLRAPELEVEATELELLIRVRGPLDVLLEAVVLVRLDDRQPREVLEEDLRHLAVRLGAELLVDREARGAPQLVPPRVAPVVLGPDGAEEPPHHAVWVGERRQAWIEVVVALCDRAVRHDAAPAPELLHDRLAIDRHRERLLHERVVEGWALAVDGEHVETRVEGAGDTRRGVVGDALAL